MEVKNSNKYFVSGRGYGICKSCLEKEEEDEIRRELTVKPNTFGYSDSSNDEFNVYLESSKKIYVPKWWGIKRFGIPDMIKVQEGDSISCEFTGKLRTIQEKPVSKFLESCKNASKQGFGGGILQLPPGWGKTVMALYIVSTLKKKTLVIVHKDFLLKQWKDRIEQYVKDAKIGIIRGKELDIDDKDIVIGSLQSISMKNYSEEVFKSFGLVVIDECHHLGASVFSQALRKVNFIYSLGLSATVNRKDGLTKVFKWYIGDILYKAKNENKGEVEVHVIDYNEEDKEYNEECTLYNNKPNVSRMLNNICDYRPRTYVIVEEIIKLYNTSEREMIILSDRRNHLIEISNMLKENSVIDFGFYVGGMKDDELRRSESKRIILGTYNMVSEGFDLPKLNTLILASPKSDIEQSIGRIQRQLVCDRKYIPLVLDIVDNFSVFTNQYKKRLKFYNKFGYKIVKDGEIFNDVKNKCEKDIYENGECLL